MDHLAEYLPSEDNLQRSSNRKSQEVPPNMLTLQRFWIRLRRAESIGRWSHWKILSKSLPPIGSLDAVR